MALLFALSTTDLMLNLTLVAFCSAFALGFFAFNRFSRPPLPPHLGSIHGILGYPWEIYCKRAETLGPLMLASVFGATVIVVNTKQAAIDLLEKRKVFACRPRWPMMELIGRQNNVGFTYYGEKLRRMRKALHKSLNSRSILESWGKFLEDQSLDLCQGLIQNPERFYELTEINVQELIVRFTYGRKPDSAYLQSVHAMTSHTGGATKPLPMSWFVANDFTVKWLPCWFPGVSLAVWTKQAKDLFLQVAREPFYEVKHKMLHGQVDTCFVEQGLENIMDDNSTPEEDIIMFAAGSLFTAGTETLSSAICTFFAIMARNPEVQRRAYQEITEVIGQSRLPSLEDRPSLVFVDCIIQEIHRFSPAVPLITHSNYEQDEYSGYRIPKKSWVLANVWGMLHDATTYPSPNEFIPERFLQDERESVPPDPRKLAYGFGRRRCPGEHFADLYLFLTISRILTLFDILPATVDGRASIPIPEFRTGIVAHIKPFQCLILPKNDGFKVL